MQEIIRIIRQLQNTNGTNDKLNILKENKDNELLQKVLYYTYNPFMKYGMSEKSINPINIKEDNLITIFDLLDKLSTNNINDKLREETNIFLGCSEQKEQELYIMMLLKDLKIGLNAKSINKVFKKLIPSFNVMLAKKYFEEAKKVEGKEFIITSKLDGSRFVIVKDNQGNVKYYTRQGQEITGMIEFKHDEDLIPNGIVIDGEVLLNKSGLHSKDLYRETMKEFRKKGEKHNLILHAFDILTYDEFIEGKSKTNCSTRKKLLHNLISSNNFSNIVEVPVLYEGYDTSMIIKLLDKAIANDEEGVMVNLADAPYECKRTSNILKVKKMQDCDLRVVGFEEGSGNFKGTLGRINVEYKGNIIGVGSGFELSMRDEVWTNQDKYIGKIAKVQYFEETTNSKNNLKSLRFPVFVEWRFDKTEPSLY